MPLNLRRTVLRVVALTLGASALIVTGQSAHATGAVIPWEPDPNSVGGLVFYNASGQQITGGSVSDTPVAAYVQGNTTIRSGDTKATLYGYLPVNGQAPGKWSGEPIGGPTTYPNASAPSALASSGLPLETGNATNDLSIANLIADFPNTDTTTDGYAHRYQLRLLTTQSGLPGNTTYDSADIEITGTGSTATWSVVYTKTVAQTTTTALAVSPTTSSVYHGTAVHLTATVTPSSAVGSVKFYNGSTVLATVPVSGGTAAYATSALTNGAHALKASFVPTDSTAYVGSTSASKVLTVKVRPTKTTLTPSATTIRHGLVLKLTSRVYPAVAGRVTFYNGTRILATVTVYRGVAVYSTRYLTVGYHYLKARFVPTSTLNYGASTSSIVRVRIT